MIVDGILSSGVRDLTKGDSRESCHASKSKRYAVPQLEAVSAR
jgi:hypothetical protein